MSLLVLKFGGSSVATASRFENVASIIEELIKCGHKLIVVVSAMQGMTNQLLELTRNFTDASIDRECDAVVSAGEQISSGLLALTLKKKGIEARSFQGWQVPIITESVFGESRVSSVNKESLINKNFVPIIAGFQGVSDAGDITTLGRGGSDASAVAVANAINADECFIYTDVDGVYTADPRIVLQAKKIRVIGYDEMIELASNGAKVLQSASVSMAKLHNVKLRVLSSFTVDEGTSITEKTEYIGKMQIAGIAYNKSCFTFSIPSSQVNRIIDEYKEKNITITNVKASLFIADRTHQFEILRSVSGNGINFDNDVGIVNIVGSDSSMITADMIRILQNNNVIIKNMYSSNLSVSIIVPFQQTEIAVNLLHDMIFE